MVGVMNDDRQDLERGSQGLTKALLWNVPGVRKTMMVSIKIGEALAKIQIELKSKAISITGREGLYGCQLYAPDMLCSPETLFFCFWYSFLLEAG
jgi:hypothetical protein